MISQCGCQVLSQSQKKEDVGRGVMHRFRKERGEIEFELLRKAVDVGVYGYDLMRDA